MPNGSKGFFITGTDTGVGKTLIAGAIIRAAQLLNLKPAGMKPVETGCGKEGGVLMPADGSYLKNIARMGESINRITPFRFETPLAPFVASGIEGTAVEPAVIIQAFRELEKKYDAVIVEGIGGLMVPITRHYFALDMARDLGLPLIVVARPSLGTINHTLLTVNYALKEGLTVAGIIINYSLPPQANEAEETNAHVLWTLCPAPLLGVFPHLNDFSSETLDRIILKNLDLDILKKYLLPDRTG